MQLTYVSDALLHLTKVCFSLTGKRTLLIGGATRFMKKLLRFALVAVLATSALPAFAQTRTWSGGNGNWSDASKWSGSNVPDTAGETASIQFGSGVGIITVDNSYSIGGLDIQFGNTLTIGTGNTLDVGTLNFQGSSFQNGSGNLVASGAATWQTTKLRVPGH